MRVRTVALASLAWLLLSAAPFAAGAAAARGGYERGASSPAPPRCSTLAPAPPARTKLHDHGLLVPEGASWVLLCRYHGLNAQAPRHLAGERLVTSPAQVVRLTGEVNALPPLQGIHCPFDDGREIVMTFGYPSRGAAVVSVGLAGCEVVSNGSLPARTATGQAGSRLLTQLTALVP